MLVNHNIITHDVQVGMIIELPDPNVMLGLAAAFVSGLIALFVYYKARPYVNWVPNEAKYGQGQRFEEYERQLVEMKIRMDSIGMEVPGGDMMSISRVVGDDIGGMGYQGEPGQKTLKITPKTNQNRPKPSQSPTNITHHNATELVLHEIRNEPKTSRDIQMVLGKSREHTARLLKKLYDDGLVKRNTDSRPYTYSITEAGPNYTKSAD